MNGIMKTIVIVAAAVFAGDKIAETFTGAGDSASEKLIWRIVGGSVVGVAISKLV